MYKNQNVWQFTWKKLLFASDSPISKFGYLNNLPKEG